MGRAAIHEGGCLCGAIRFRAEGPPERPHTCSCSLCRRHSGAMGLGWVEFPRDRVTWTGPGGTPAAWRSSDRSSRAFCATCGSTIGALDDAPVVALALGSFDRPGGSALRPTVHSYVAGAPAWWRAALRAITAG